MALQNDWIVAGINNPDFTVSDFANFADMTTENTQLLGADDYIRTDFIQNHPYFRDDAGNFNEDLFRNYYNARAQEFDTFAQDEFYRGPALDIFDLDRTQETPVKDIGFNITRGFNPDRQQIGIEGVNVWSDPKFSQREIAKQNRVFNTERGEFEDWTVNDHTLVSNVKDWFNDLWREPLVLATWDDDGVHVDPMTGLPQEHVKGQPKLNEKGTYYYETLGNRSVLGKDVLSAFDTLTVDGEGLNKYDFFDSNDLHKSVGGTIMKNFAMLIPYFIPGVSSVYSGVLLARELTKTLPMLTGMVTSLTGGDTPQWAETASAWAQRATPSTDDWSMRHPWAAGHFIGLVTDLALLTGQQKFIADALGAARGGQRYILEAQENAQRLFASKAEKYGGGEDVWRACLQRFMPQAERMATKSGQLGRDLGLAYITLTFQHSTYEEMLMSGASKQEASAVALGAMLGMFSVDKWLHLGEIFYDDATGDATKMARSIAKREAQEMSGKMRDIWKVDDSAQLGILKSIRSAHDKARGLFGDYAGDLRYHTLTAAGKMMGSGVERVAETMVGDLSKGMYELAGQFGADTSVKDVGAFENMADRYGMAFAAGVLGAGVHYGKELLQRGTLRVPRTDEQLETLVRNGHADELKAEVDKLERAGRTGSRTLSARPIFGTEKNADKVIGWETSKDGDRTQARIVADAVRDKIDEIDAVINGNNIGLTDDELFENAVMGERRLMALRDLAPATGWYQRVADAYANVYRAYRESMMSERTSDGKPGEKVTETEWQNMTQDQRNKAEKQHQEYVTKYEDALAAVKGIASGEAALDFSRMLAFMADSSVNSHFLQRWDSATGKGFKSYEDLCAEKYGGRSPDQLDGEELKSLRDEWATYRRTELPGQIQAAYELFKTLERQTLPVMEKAAGDVDGFRERSGKVNDVLDLTFRDFFNNRQGTLKDHEFVESRRLPDESDIEYEHRAKKYVDPDTGREETDEEYEGRRKARKEKIEDINKGMREQLFANLSTALDEADWTVDLMTKRRIKETLGEFARPRDVVERVVRDSGVSDLVRGELLRLDGDLSNAEQVIGSVREKVVATEVAKARTAVEGAIRALRDMRVTDTDGVVTDLHEYYNSRFDNPLESLTASEYLEEVESLFAGEDPEYFTFDKAGDEAHDILFDMTPESRNEVRDVLRQFVERNAGNASLVGEGDGVMRLEGFWHEINAGDFVKGAEEAAHDLAESEVNAANGVVSAIRNDFVWDFVRKIKTDVKNPTEELLNELARIKDAEMKGADKESAGIPQDVTKILGVILNDYDTLESLSQFALDSGQEANIRELRDIVAQLRAYITAASSWPDPFPFGDPIGHNRFINSFVERNADRLRVAWNKLPELDADVAETHLKTLDRIELELGHWLRMSADIQADRKSKILAMDAKMARMDLMTIRGVSPNVTVNGQPYNVLSGIEGVTDAGGDDAGVLRATVDSARVLYNNIERIAADNGMSVPELLERTDILVQMLGGEEAAQKVLSQFNVDISEAMDGASTPYSRAVYLLTMLCERPDNYYGKLLDSLEKGDTLIPIAAQEPASRMGHAMFDGALSRMTRKLWSVCGAEKVGMPLIENFIFVEGRAGAGKTAKCIRDAVAGIDGKDIWLIAPSDGTLKNTLASLKRDGVRTMTIEQAEREMLGEKMYKDWLSEAGPDTKKEVDDKDSYDGPLFTIRSGGVDSAGRKSQALDIRLNADKIKFADIKRRPKAIIVDEAQNLTTLDAMLFDLFAKGNGAKGVMAGDLSQVSSSLGGYGIGSIEPACVFMARTPKLKLSMRVTNTQQAQVERMVGALADRINADIDNPDIPPEAFNRDIGKYVEMARRLNVPHYIGKGKLNGLMIVDTVPDGVVSTLKGLSDAGERIAFVGEKTSAVLQGLRDGGVKVADEDVMKLNDVKGREYDHVVVDYRWDDNRLKTYTKDGMALRGLVQEFYTLATRALKGTVMIDNGISGVVGSGVRAEVTGDAPSASEYAKELGDNKLRMLRSVELKDRGKAEIPDHTVDPPADPEDVSEPDGKSKSKGKGKGGGKRGAGRIDPPVSADDLTVDPEERPEGSAGAIADRDVEEAIKAMESGEDSGAGMFGALEGVGENDWTDAAGEGFVTSALLDMAAGGEPEPESQSDLAGRYETSGYNLMVLSVEDGGSKTVTDHFDEKNKRKRPVWRIRHPESGPLRNLQAIVGKEVEVVRYHERREDDGTLSYGKIELQNRLKKVRDAALYKHKYEELDTFIKDMVSEDAWKARRIAIEFRNCDDTILPLYSPKAIKRCGMSIEGYERPIYANYVVVLEGRDGRQLVFDLVGLNSPETLSVKASELRRSFGEAAKADGRPKEEADWLRRQSEAVVPAAERYSAWFMGMLESARGELDDGGSVLFDVTGPRAGNGSAPKAVLNMRSWFTATKGKPVQLDGTVNLDTINTSQRDRGETGRELERDAARFRSFISTHPGCVFSKVHVIRGKDIAALGLSTSLKNKAVIYWSDDTTLDAADLPGLYKAYRTAYRDAVVNGTTRPNATVRMYVLENRGLSLWDLIDTEYMYEVNNVKRPERGSGTDDGERVKVPSRPLNNNYMGAWMFLTLWNARAAVNDFIGRLEEWKGENGLSDEQVVALARAHDMTYRGGGKAGTAASLTEVRDVLGQAGLLKNPTSAAFDSSNEDFDTETGTFRVIGKIRQFNGEAPTDGANVADVRFFRLGSYDNVHGRDYGFHVQRYRVKEGMYRGSEANMAAVTEECARGFSEMLENLLGPITKEGSGVFEVRGVRPVLDADGNPTSETEDYLWDKGTPIDLRREDAKGAMESMAHRIVTNGKKSGDVGDMTFGNSKYFSMMMKFVRELSYKTYRVGHGQTLHGEDVKHEVVNTDGILGSDGRKIGDITFDVDRMTAKAGVQGHNLTDMLGLLFHGTTDDIFRWYGNGRDDRLEPIMQMDDAVFKNGFYIEPWCSSGDPMTVEYRTPDGREIQMESVPCETGGEFFLVGMEPHGADIRMRVDDMESMTYGGRTTFDELIRAGRESVGRGEDMWGDEDEPTVIEVSRAQAAPEQAPARAVPEGEAEAMAGFTKRMSAIGMMSSPQKAAEAFNALMDEIDAAVAGGMELSEPLKGVMGRVTGKGGALAKAGYRLRDGRMARRVMNGGRPAPDQSPAQGNVDEQGNGASKANVPETVPEKVPENAPGNVPDEGRGYYINSVRCAGTNGGDTREKVEARLADPDFSAEIEAEAGSAKAKSDWLGLLRAVMNARTSDEIKAARKAIGPYEDINSLFLDDRKTYDILFGNC